MKTYFSSKNNGKKLKWLHRARNLILIGAAIALLFTFVIGASKVSGFSMYPTLENGDIVFYWRLNKNPKRGDILALNLPSGEGYVKRVAAVAGDTVDLKDGVFYVNGVAEEGMETLPEEGNFIYPATIGPGDLFMLGDNRPESIDSRAYGTFSLKQVRGVLKVRIHGLKVEFY